MKNTMNNAFTLAEVLITLAIIGVVAAITIPSVIVNTNQMEFKTGLRKAVSVLNQAITLNKALTGESPYDNSDLYNYLQQYMSVTKGRISIYHAALVNYAFYTTDGMRYEIPESTGGHFYDYKLYESDINIGDYIKNSTSTLGNIENLYGNCGSYGLTHNQDSTTNPPCIVIVDVNGDRKPSPRGSVKTYPYVWYSYGVSENGWEEYYTSPEEDTAYKYADANGRLLTDIFPIMITDQGAIPYGVVAQKAMYQAQK